MFFFDKFHNPNLLQISLVPYEVEFLHPSDSFNSPGYPPDHLQLPSPNSSHVAEHVTNHLPHPIYRRDTLQLHAIPTSKPVLIVQTDHIISF